MHVVLHHDAVVPPAEYGGTERIVHWLGVALQRMGHRVTLLAREGSRLEGATIVPLRAGTPLAAQVPADAEIVQTFSPDVGDLGVPVVTVIEGNAPPGTTFPRNTLFVSRKHAQNHSSSKFVYNGIDPEHYESAERRDDYAVFLGNPSWDVKNVRGAIDVARAAGLRLEVLGPIEHGLRWKRFLPPFARGVTWRGSVGDAAKRPILARAKALIFPVRWHEPFGIAITEALASGCAVVGTPYGSLPEIVTPDVGALSADGAELARALRRGDWSPERCRARVRDGFTHADMARTLLRHYESVLRTGHLVDPDPEPPRTAPGFVYHELLPWTSPR